VSFILLFTSTPASIRTLWINNVFILFSFTGSGKGFEIVFDLKETFSLSLIRGFHVLTKSKTPGLAKHEIQNLEKKRILKTFAKTFRNFSKIIY
jgi:hypothetical protein